METLHHLPNLPSFPSNSSTQTRTKKFKLKLKINNPNHNHYYFSNPRKPKPLIPLPDVSSYFIKCSSHSHNHDHHHHHHDHHDHHHGHQQQQHSHNCCGGCDDGGQLTKTQQSFLSFAEAIRWAELASFLREHLELCCCSAALFVAAGACPYVLPKPAVVPLQRAFTAVAFPLVGVSASFDAVMDIAGGKIIFTC